MCGILDEIKIRNEDILENLGVDSVNDKMQIVKQRRFNYIRRKYTNASV